MTNATNILAAGTKNPTTDQGNLNYHTQCSLFKVDDVLGNDYVASITGQVGGTTVALGIEINVDDPAYQTPGTPLRPGDTNRGGSAQLQLQSDATPRNSVVGPHGEEPAVIVLHDDKRSGNLNAWFGEDGESQTTGVGVMHVQGDWRCG